MKFFKNRKGFTLVELVVVIAILGILAGIAIPRFMDATASARGAKVVADLRTIDSAIMMHYAKEGSAPSMANLTANGAYLASEPKPPAGDCIITNNAGKQITHNVAAATTSYAITTATGGTARATINAKTVDDLLAASAKIQL
ncbi:MAG: competence type IV pilus major pilin ComGC [Acidaminococcaceae bacterium]